MADIAAVRRGIQTIMQDHLSSKVVAMNTPRLVLLNFIAMKTGDKKGIYGMGRPMVDGKVNTGIIVSRSETAKARKEEIFGSLVYQPIIRFRLPPATDNKVITSRTDNDPSRADWANNQTEQMFVRPAFKWFILTSPGKVSKLTMRMTTAAAKNDVRAWEAIGSLFTAEASAVNEVHHKSLNERLIGLAPSDGKSPVAGRPSNESAEWYDNLFGLEAALHDANIYGGVDRTVVGNEWWKGNRVATPVRTSFEDMINFAKYQAPRPLANFGLNVDLMLVGNALFVKAIAEGRAKGSQPIYEGACPEFAEFGIKNDAVRIGRTWIVNEPEFPAGHCAGLSLDTFTVAIHPKANFTVSEPADQQKIEGGSRAVTFTEETQIMACCEWPAGNVYWTDVA